jgi:DNA-binding NtrC family response regulator
MQLKVYYIDDEEALCENFSDYFSSAEVCVKTFNDPQAAINYIEKNPPDLLFIDYRLSGTTGDQVAMAMDPKLPKFLITGDASFKIKYKFNGVFPKPYTESAIAAVISSYLSGKKAA